MRTRTSRLAAAGLLAATLLLGASPRADAEPPTSPKPLADTLWSDKALGISGITPMPGLSRSNLGSPALVVHDAKTKNDPPPPAAPRPRVSLAMWGGDGFVRSAVEWPVGEPGADVPNDLEAASSVPGMTGHAILAESSGRLFHVVVAMRAGPNRLTVITPAPPPLPRWGGKEHEKEGGEVPECEGFALTQIDGHLVAVWGERGTKSAAGSIFFAPFDLEKGVDVDALGALSVRVPEPTGNDVRDVSEIAIGAENSVWFSSADDEGDAGPFTSAIYRLGTLRTSKAGLYIEREPEPALVRRIAGHKVEAFLPGYANTFLMASDDEDAGAWLRWEREAPPAPCDPPPAPQPR